MKVSLAPTTLRGKRVWVVSWKPPGSKRQRRYFESRNKAEREQGAIKFEHAENGRAWMVLDARERSELIQAWHDAKAAGFTLREAVEAKIATASQDPKPVDPMVTSGKALEQFLKEKKTAGLATKTRTGYKSNVGRFIEGREEQPIAEITREAILAWLSRPEWGARTFNGYLASLKIWLRWAVQAGLLEASPAAQIKPIGARQMPDLDKEPVILSTEQTAKLLHVTRKQDSGLLPYVALCVFAGLRPEREAGRICWEDIGDGVLVRGLHAKDRQRREVEKTPALAAWLDLGGDLPAKNLRRRFERIRAAAGLIRLHIVEGRKRPRVEATGWAQDCLRHTFASHALPVFGEDWTRRQLGHGNFDMLFRHYRALVPKEEAEAFWRIMPGKRRR